MAEGTIKRPVTPDGKRDGGGGRGDGKLETVADNRTENERRRQTEMRKQRANQNTGTKNGRIEREIDPIIPHHHHG